MLPPERSELEVRTVSNKHVRVVAAVDSLEVSVQIWEISSNVRTNLIIGAFTASR